MKLVVLFLFLIIPLYSSKQKPKYVIDTNWTTYSIDFTANLPIKGHLDITKRQLVRDDAKDTILTQASFYLENFVVDHNLRIKNLLSVNNSFSQKYSIFLEDQNLTNLFFKSGQIQAKLKIPLRGKNGLISKLPIDWYSERYQILEPKELISQAYEKRDVQGEFFRSLSPVKYSGLIIDATDQKLNVALLPRVYTQQGKLIYGPEFLFRNTASERGIVGYVKSVKDPLVRKRTGQNPLIVSALNVTGFLQTDLVISDRDAANLLDHQETAKNLLKCKVIVIYNSYDKMSK